MKLLKFQDRDMNSEDYQSLTRVQQKVVDNLPLQTNRFYEGKDTGEHYEIEFNTGIKVLPKSWFTETESPEIEGDTVIFWRGGSPDQKRRKEERHKANPFETTLPEYRKKIERNSELAREAKAKAGIK